MSDSTAAAPRSIVVDAPPAAPAASGAALLPLEYLVVDAERRFEVNGKVQNLSFWTFKTLCRARHPAFLNPQDSAPGGAADAGTDAAAKARKHFVVSVDGSHVDYCSFHRYSDFEWMRNRLKEDFPGLLLPPVPEKDSDGTLDKIEDLVAGKDHQKVSENPFIASRMRQLNLFVQSLQPLTQLHSSEHIKAFVTLREPQWIEYKERVNKANEKPITAKRVFGGMKRFFGSIGKTKVPVFDDAHPVTRIQNRLREFADTMAQCGKYLEQASKTAHAPWEPRPDDGSMAAMAKHQLPPPLLFISHRVSSRDKMDGTIVHVDDASGRVYVDWHNGTSPEPVAQNTLSAPSTGVVDPVALLLSQVVSAIDSTVIEMRSRDAAGVLKEAFDYCHFLANWAKDSVVLVDEVAKIQEDFRTLTADKQSASPPDVPALEAECLALEKKFEAAKDAVVSSYHAFLVPQRRIGIQRICRLAGASCSNMLRSDDWAERMQAPAHLYECRYDEVHPAVLPLLKQQRDAAAAVVTMPADAAAAADQLLQQQPHVSPSPPSANNGGFANDSIHRQGASVLAPPPSE